MPTAYEIYQTYLKGPAALIRLFKQALGTEAIYGPPPELGVEAVNMIRKGQVKRFYRSDAMAQAKFVESLFGVAA